MPSPPVKKNTAASRVTGSRVLTRAEGYAILQEKEEKKRKEKEEKDRRKQEREEKKCEKQEVFRKQAEGKAKNHFNRPHKEQGTREGCRQPMLPLLRYPPPPLMME